jgi:hypothetical protein
MKFEVTSALVVGAGLPLLETIRRGFAHWTVNVTTMLEDYVAGGLLLLAGVLAIRGKPSAPLVLVLAWAYVTGLMSSSFWYQFEATLRGVNLEPLHFTVLGFKVVLWGTCVTSLLLSFRHAAIKHRN